MATKVNTETQLPKCSAQSRPSAEDMERQLSEAPPSDSRVAADSEPVPPSLLKSALLMATLACVSFLNTFNHGVLTVSLPTIAAELGLPVNLQLWPASVYALAMSCNLLLFGAVADIVGNRPIFLVGNMLYTAWTLAVSLSRTGNQLIAFRTLQGVAMALCMPTAVSTITTTFPRGKLRNVAFATFGGGNPLGFAAGLVLGGVFVHRANWRTAYYMSLSINFVAFILAWFTIPSSSTSSGSSAGKSVWARLASELDWVGTGSISVCLALISYLCAQFTYSDMDAIMRKPENITLLILAVLLIPFFVLWENRQERLARPVMLPNSVWRTTEFTVVCVVVFLVWGWFNSYGYWATLVFQKIQELSALQTAVRFLPMVFVGVAVNIAAALLVDRISAGILVSVGGLVTMVAPLLFALQDPSWSYWLAGFPAMCLSVVSTDILFSVSNLVITTNFPPEKQALAGGVFNTVTQLGTSLGLAVTAIVAETVTDAGPDGLRLDKSENLKGYRAAFWTCFAAAAASVVISIVGLRKAGKVGAKQGM